MKKAILITRYILTASLIGLAYFETGVFTAVTLALIAISIEMNNVIHKKEG